MFRLNKKTLIFHCIFIVAIMFLFVGAFPQLGQVIPALALTATPSPATRPDLTITLSNVRLGGACENRWGIQASVRNASGIAITTPFVVRFNGVQERTINGLAANTTTTVQFNGNFTAGIGTVDASNIIVETNESNNSTAVNLEMAPTPTSMAPATCTPGTPTATRTNTPPGLTNLRVVSISRPGLVPACGGQLVTNVTVANGGSLSTTANFVVRFNNVQDKTVNGLAAGQSVTLQFTAPWLPFMGTQWAVAAVDATNVLPEYSENDNWAIMNYAAPTPVPGCTPSAPVPTNTPPSGALPDLTVTNIALGNFDTCKYSIVPIRVTVANIGTANAGTFVLQASNLATSNIPTQTIYGLAAGQSTTVEFIFPAFGTFQALADSTSVITESNENNNSKTVTIPPIGAPCIPSATPTRSVTPTRTNTPFPDPTPTSGSGICSPLNATITAPFTFDGAGTRCWRINSIPNYINSWNTTSVTVNGVNFTNLWASPSQLPAKASDGYWYISYNSSSVWGHFEAK